MAYLVKIALTQKPSSVFYKALANLINLWTSGKPFEIVLSSFIFHQNARVTKSTTTQQRREKAKSETNWLAIKMTFAQKQRK